MLMTQLPAKWASLGAAYSARNRAIIYVAAKRVVIGHCAAGNVNDRS
jgi:hypothetical protein